MANIEDRLGRFLDKWQFAFNSDSDLEKNNRKTDDFYSEASELYIFLLGNGGAESILFAQRFLASIPGISKGIAKVFSDESAKR